MSAVKFIVILTITSMALLFLGQVILEHSSLKAVMQVLRQHHWLMNIWRYFIYIIVVIGWPYFIKIVGKSKQWPMEMISYLSNQRVKLCLLFIMVEMFFVYNVLGYLLSYL